MDILVEDVLVEIASRSSCLAISNLGITCKSYNRLMKDERLWQHLVNRDYYDIATYNIGELYLQQYKYLCHTLRSDKPIETAIRANRMDAICFVLKYSESLQTEGIMDNLVLNLKSLDMPLTEALNYQLRDEHILLALQIGNLQVLQLPPIMTRITDKLLSAKAKVYIPNISILEWLCTLGRTINRNLLGKILNHSAVTESDMLSVVPWFINKEIFPTPTMVRLITTLNYKKLYLILYDKGLAINDSANICCGLGYLDMLEILKGLGIMPTGYGLYEAYMAAPERAYILRWLKHNNIQGGNDFVSLAITRDDAASLEMFTRNYNYTSLDISNVVQHDCVNVFRWMQQQGIINRLESTEEKPYPIQGMKQLSYLYLMILQNTGTYNAYRILKVLDDQGILDSASAIYNLLYSPQRAPEMVNWVLNRIKPKAREAFLEMVPKQSIDICWLQRVLIHK